MLLLPSSGEVLDEKIASLLGGLVSDGLPLLLSISLEFAQGASDNELGTFHVLLVQSLNSLGSTSGSVLLVFVLGVIIANKAKPAELRLLEEHGLDGTIGLEELSDLFIRHSGGKVLDIDVVDELSHGGLVVSGLEHVGLDTLGQLLCLGGLESCGGRVGVLEADEAVSIGVVLGSQTDLQGLDRTELGENIMQLLMVEFVLGNLDENVVGKQFLFVGTEELLVEGKGSAGFALNIEVSHLLTGRLVLIRVLDHNHGGIEGLGDVLFDLRLLGILEGDTGLFLEGLGDLDGSHFLLGQVIQIHEVLSCTVHC